VFISELQHGLGFLPVVDMALAVGFGVLALVVIGFCVVMAYAFRRGTGGRGGWWVLMCDRGASGIRGS
jgi:hypothetical protein